jgi:stage V sporulation protein B
MYKDKVPKVGMQMISVLIKQLALRTSAIFLVKLLGFFARIPLFRMLGPEGIGLYQMAYSVYGLILTLIIGGFPTALAIATSKNPREGWRLFERISFILLLLSSVFAGTTFYLSSDIASFLGDSQLDFAIQCLTPAILIVPVLSLFRGFLQGIERFEMIAISEILEQMVRTSVMLIFVFIWIHRGIAITVGGASLGAFAGAMAGILFLITFYIREKRVPSASGFLHLVKRLTLDKSTLLFLNTSLAITGTRILIPISDFLDALIVPQRLQDAGFNLSGAVSLYGELTGMAVLVAYIPTIMTAALTHTMTARITMDWQKKSLDRFYSRCKTMLVVGWLWGIGSGLFLFLYADELSLLMFGTDSIAKAIRFLSIAPLIGGIREVSMSILWVIGRRKEPLIGLIIGIATSILLNYYLVAIPGMSYIGMVIGLLSIDSMAALYNLIVLLRRNITVRFITLILESIFLGVLLYLSFRFIGEYLDIGVFSSALNNILKMSVFYGLLFLYLYVRFSKGNRLRQIR